ncbi:amino acid adenylation domain-containing protein [Sphaerimonospora cavernae]|uniref:Amino acid adenylation domain-containing protein n=1 Tax=Sphaerimonospora cavernae TaxID=1740611 RepID=A0ABV6TZ04_9ACTN
MNEFPAAVVAANRTDRPFDEAATVIDLLDRAARHHAGRTALRTPSGAAVTHAGLATTSRRMAAALTANGVEPGTPVALLIDHTPTSVAGLIAVVRAGAYYVPLDPRWPDTRIAEVLTSLKVRALVVAPEYEGRAFEIGCLAPGLRQVFRVPGTAPAAGKPRLAEVAEIWDGITDSDDVCVAAGFNLDPRGFRFEVEQVEDYARHVAGLVLEHYRPGSTVVEIGAGSGLIVRKLAPKVARLLALDGAPASMRRLGQWARRTGLPVTAEACWAHEARDAVARADPSVLLLAAVVQYFPDLRYLRQVLGDLIAAVSAGTVIVVADLVDPDSGQFQGSLRIPPAWWRELAGHEQGFDVSIRPRPARSLAGPLRDRYDVVLTVTGESPAPFPAARPGSPEAPLLLDTSQREGNPRQAPLQPGDLAYTITTSGSTGAPKAVAVRHSSVVNLVEWFNRRHGVGPGDTLAQVASFSFDLSVYDVFGVLAAGGSLLLLPDRDLGEPARLLDTLVTHRATLWNSAPAAFTAVLAFLHGRPGEGGTALRRVFLSGDWVPLTLHEELVRAFPAAVLVALGGATEACVWSNDFIVHQVETGWTSIPYGHPMQNARYYVLDEHGVPCGIDEPGELYIGGECAAVGYTNDPALTSERFVPDPWSAQRGGRMYRTGDRACWTSQGWVEFLGRTDHQIKVRGYRIELGEIEHAASRMDGVAEAVAVPLGEPRDPVIGLAVRGHGVSEQAVREYLRETLPPYMEPSRIRVLATLPVSATGKVDRRQLKTLLTAERTVRTVRLLAAGNGLPA